MPILIRTVWIPLLFWVLAVPQTPVYADSGQINCRWGCRSDGPCGSEHIESGPERFIGGRLARRMNAGRKPWAVAEQGNGTQATRCPPIIWITSPRMMTGRLLRGQFDPPTSSNRGRSDMCHRYSRQRRGLRCVPFQPFLIGLRFTGRMNLVIGLNRFVPAGTRATAFYYSMPLTVRPYIIYPVGIKACRLNRPTVGVWDKGQRSRLTLGRASRCGPISSDQAISVGSSTTQRSSGQKMLSHMPGLSLSAAS